LFKRTATCIILCSCHSTLIRHFKRHAPLPVPDRGRSFHFNLAASPVNDSFACSTDSPGDNQLGQHPEFNENCIPNDFPRNACTCDRTNSGLCNVECVKVCGYRLSCHPCRICAGNLLSRGDAANRFPESVYDPRRESFNAVNPRDDPRDASSK